MVSSMTNISVRISCLENTSVLAFLCAFTLDEKIISKCKFNHF